MSINGRLLLTEMALLKFHTLNVLCIRWCSFINAMKVSGTSGRSMLKVEHCVF